MNRRRFLAAVGSGTTVAVGGCLAEETPTSTRSPTASPPVPPAIDSQPCPPFPIDGSRAVCSHTVDSDTADIHLDPEPATVTLAGRTPRRTPMLTLYNRTDEKLEWGASSWRLWYTAGETWTKIERASPIFGLNNVAPHETMQTSFRDVVSLFLEESDPPLKRGLYGVAIDVSPPDGEEKGTSCVALVRVLVSR